MIAGPTVSVVIPTYNRANIVGDAIESVLDQTYDNIEIIVIDDASEDNTKEVVSKYNHDCLNYIRHNTNKGISVTRNTGIRASCGKYISFLDSDDEWREDKLRKQVELLEDGSNEFTAAYCGVQNSNESTLFTFSKNMLNRIFNSDEQQKEGGEGLISPILCNRLYIGGASTLIVNKKYFDKYGGFNEEFYRLNDMEFVLKFLQRGGKLGYVAEDLVIHNYTGFGVEANEVPHIKAKYLKEFSDIVVDLEINGKEVISIHRFDIARRYFLNGQMRKGFRYLLKAKPPNYRNYIGMARAVSSGIMNTLR